MNLGILLGIGESLSQMEKSGQKGRFINQYLTRYSKDFEKVYLFSYADESDNLPKNVILVPKKSSLHRYLYALLIPLINRKQIKDCDVIRGFGLTSAVPALLISKPFIRRKTSFIFNLPYDYSGFLKIEKKYYLIPLFKVLEKLAFSKAKIVLVATKQMLKTQKRLKFIYFPNGVDLTVFRRKGSLGKGLVFIGRLEKQKNLFFLIDAVSKLPENMRSVTFVGSGSQEFHLKKYATKKKVSLKILPPIKNSQLPKLLSKFSIFTLPSLAEGSPKVLLEAMALGLVPVVTNFSTAKEVIKDNLNGFITNYDAKTYSRKLEMLIKDSDLRKKMSKNAIQSVSDNFNLEKLIAHEIKILKEVAK